VGDIHKLDNLLTGVNGRLGLQVFPNTVKYRERDVMITVYDLEEPFVDYLSRHVEVHAGFNLVSALIRAVEQAIDPLPGQVLSRIR